MTKRIAAWSPGKRTLTEHQYPLPPGNPIKRDVKQLFGGRRLIDLNARSCVRLDPLVAE
jgi:hypothetical protein